ncbi:MAG TPA: hypothetical protein VFS47_06975 [Steroidobacteraceae bacterium]|nr:hypothetical protein [Steroidobacteraceae bacterium]
MAIAVGLAGLLLAVRTTARRLLGFVVYVCVAIYVLFYYSLSFVCGAFGDCL